jgi:hypothetical protein
MGVEFSKESKSVVGFEVESGWCYDSFKYW